jgi:hypothetical protein
LSPSESGNSALIARGLTNRPRPLKPEGRLAHRFGARQEPGNGHGNGAALYHDGSLGDWHVIGENRDLVVLAGAELDDGAAAHAEELMDGDWRRAQNHRYVAIDVVYFGHLLPPPENPREISMVMVSE